jgi:hypothetical protein
MAEITQPQMGLNFEQVWAALMETDRQMKETDQRITKMNRELNRAIGKLSNRFGELIEHLVSPNLLEKFKALNYQFSQINTRVKCQDINTGKILAEIDVLLENGDFMLAVEIKSDPSQDDIDDHFRRMEILRAYADARNDKRRYIGAIAGGIVSNNVKNYALKNGFYVIEQSGDTVNITATPESWKPRTW